MNSFLVETKVLKLVLLNSHFQTLVKQHDKLWLVSQLQLKQASEDYY